MMSEASKVRRLEVSIVLYRSDLDKLRVTLEKLHASAARALESRHLDGITVQLIDNASGPDYRESLRELLATFEAQDMARYDLRLQCQERNAGFGAGHNAALLGSAADVLLVLNPDVELDQHALLRACEFLDNTPDAIALNPHSERADGTREYLCKRYPSVLDFLLRGFGGRRLRARFSRRLAHYEYRDRPACDPGVVDILSGACLLCRASAFQALGGFDERYFLYFEDYDLSRRLANRGGLYFCPAMKILHHGGDAARKGPRHIGWFVRSAARFFSSHGWRFS